MNSFDTQVAAQELGIPALISLQGLLKHFFEVDVSKLKEKYQVLYMKENKNTIEPSQFMLFQLLRCPIGVFDHCLLNNSSMRKVKIYQ